jgi:hypothetical protein
MTILDDLKLARPFAQYSFTRIPFQHHICFSRRLTFWTAFALFDHPSLGVDNQATVKLSRSLGVTTYSFFQSAQIAHPNGGHGGA